MNRSFCRAALCKREDFAARHRKQEIQRGRVLRKKQVASRLSAEKGPAGKRSSHTPDPKQKGKKALSFVNSPKVRQGVHNEKGRSGR